MEVDFRALLQVILRQYALPLDGDHGVAHWARVWENAMRLAQTTGADVQIVQLFAVLHDSRRLKEMGDPHHGQRAADFAAELRGTCFQLADADFDLLYQACAGHTHQHSHRDITVQTCWDADRLDLGRVGITPQPPRLCTEVARSKHVIDWAHGRACFRIVPDLVHEQWQIVLPSERTPGTSSKRAH